MFSKLQERPVTKRQNVTNNVLRKDTIALPLYPAHFIAQKSNKDCSILFIVLVLTILNNE